MKLYLLSGKVLRKAGEFLSSESFEGFCESYSLDPLVIDGIEYSKDELVIVRAVEVESNTSLRLKFSNSVVQTPTIKPTPKTTEFDDWYCTAIDAAALRWKDDRLAMLNIAACRVRLSVHVATLAPAERNRERGYQYMLRSAEIEMEDYLDTIYGGHKLRRQSGDFIKR